LISWRSGGRRDFHPGPESVRASSKLKIYRQRTGPFQLPNIIFSGSAKIGGEWFHRIQVRHRGPVCRVAGAHVERRLQFWSRKQDLWRIMRPTRQQGEKPHRKVFQASLHRPRVWPLWESVRKHWVLMNCRSDEARRTCAGLRDRQTISQALSRRVPWSTGHPGQPATWNNHFIIQLRNIFD
jgi:hypothetical protein